MNTINKYIAVILFATLLGLTACSGSDSGKPSTTTSPTNKPARPNATAQPETPTQSTTPFVIPTATNQGTALTAPQGNVAKAQNIMVNGDHQSDIVVIDGHAITISKQNDYTDALVITKTNTETTAISTPKYGYVRFGGYMKGNEHTNNDPQYTFAIGDITPSSAIPATGIANYIGSATLGSNNNIELGTSSFYVDFGEKTIVGGVAHTNDSVHIPLQGIINGNTFNGSLNGVTMQGHFFGPQAEEIGGTYSGNRNSQSYMGSFGAIKQ